MGGSSAPAGASGVPSNNIPTAMAYQPTAQPTSDVGIQDLFGGLFSNLGPAFAGSTGFPAPFNDLGTNAFGWTPGGVAYPQSTAWTGAGSITDPNNPLLQTAIQAPQTASTQYAPSIAALLGQTGAGSGSTTGAGAAGTALENMGAPYATAGSSVYGTGSQVQNLAQLISSQIPGVAGGLGGVTPAAGTNIGNYAYFGLPTAMAAADLGQSQLVNSSNQILNTGFDPQSALFDQLQNQVAQQSAAANASAGLGGSAYGASSTGNTLSNFDINWQNQQLARQQAALGSAETGYQVGGQLAPSVLQAYGNASALGQNLSALPGQLASGLSSGVSNLEQGAANLMGTGLGFDTTGIQDFLQGSQLPFQTAASQASALQSPLSYGVSLAGQPYSTQSTGAGNATNLLGQTVNIGNQQFTIPQQIVNDLQSYLGLGQSASSLSGQLGALGQQESLQSMAGLGSALGTGSNLLFGNSLGSSGGFLGAAGLNPFSTGAGAAGLGASDFGGSIGSVGAAAGPTFADAAGGAFGGGDIATVGAADAATAGGSGFSLGSLLPFGASG